MNFDRNTVIGFVALAVLFFAYFFYNNKQQMAYEKQKAYQDSVANAHKPKPNPATVTLDSLHADSAARQASAGEFQAAVNGAEKLDTVKTGLMKIVFTNRGGQPKSVELENFKGPDSTNVKLASTDFDKISYSIKSANNTTANITDFYFSGGQVTMNPDSSQTITFQLDAAGKSIVHQFVVKPRNYMIDFNLQVNGANQLFNNNTIDLYWQNQALKLQKDVSYERQQSQIGYLTDGNYDHSSAMKTSGETFNKPVSWVAVKQQFFNTTLIAKNNFTSGSVNWTAPATADAKTIVQATANLKLQIPNTASANIPLAIYYGPTDYKTLKQYNNGMEEMVNLGSGIFSFVKYINRWIIIPIFDLFSKLTSNFGIVILLLTLFIRLVISPLTYTSYLSGAKMKVLRPEIDQLKAKYGKDQQQISM